MAKDFLELRKKYLLVCSGNSKDEYGNEIKGCNSLFDLETTTLQFRKQMDNFGFICPICGGFTKVVRSEIPHNVLNLK